MAATRFKNPAYFQIQGMNSVLARQDDLWLAAGISCIGNGWLATVFERGDEAAEAHAAEHGYDGCWITLEEAHELEAPEALLRAHSSSSYPQDD